MSLLRVLGEAIALVDRGEITLAVQRVLDTREDAEALTDILRDAASWSDAGLADFREAHGRDYLLRSPWGRFWLTPTVPRRRLLPPAPVIVPHHLKVLARAVIEAVS